jgi:hypothetical protein
MMRRVTLVDDVAYGRALARQRSELSLATVYAREMDNNFKGEILPRTFSDTFRGTEAPLYVARRNLGDGPQGSEPFAYEREFHEMETTADCRLLFVEGREGMGKSTFLRYYYDCYRPEHSGGDKKGNRLLVLYSDVRHSTDIRNLEENIYGAIARQVRARFPEISVENDYGMWGPKAMWSDPAHAVASKHYKSLAQYRADVAKNFLTDVRIFAECALWYLTVGPGRSHHSTDVSLVLDNVDQLDRALQVMVLRIVLRWAGAPMCGSPVQIGNEHSPPGQDANPLPDLCRIVVVVRPETLRTLRYAINPLPAHRTFLLGRVDEIAVIAARRESLTAAVIGSGRQIERDVDREDDSTTMYEVLPPRVAATRIRQILDYNDVALLDEKSAVLPGGQYRARRTLTQLVDGSVRRMLDIRSRLLRSRHLENSVVRSSESRSL